MINRRTKGRPAIVHSPGMANPDYELTNPCWRHALKISQKTKSNQPEDTEIILCNNLRESVAEYSLKNAGLRFTVLGKEIRDWDNMKKVKLVLDHLKESETKNVLYMDSTDVVIVDDLAPCIERFSNENCEILFNAELKFYPSCPSLSEIEEFERKISPNEYFALNAGCWIGRREFVTDVMEELLDIEINEHIEANRGFLDEWRVSKSDQFRWHLLYHRHSPRIKLDHECSIFQNVFLHGSGDLGLSLM